MGRGNIDSSPSAKARAVTGEAIRQNIRITAARELGYHTQKCLRCIDHRPCSTRTKIEKRLRW